jgi:hypothetical protein
MQNGTNFELYVLVDDELMKVTSQVGNVLTVVRAQYGTFAVAHSADVDVNFRFRILEIRLM